MDAVGGADSDPFKATAGGLFDDGEDDILKETAKPTKAAATFGASAAA